MDVAFGKDLVGVIYILRQISTNSFLVFRTRVKCPLLQSQQLFLAATKEILTASILAELSLVEVICSAGYNNFVKSLFTISQVSAELERCYRVLFSMQAGIQTVAVKYVAATSS
jgi:hypothetical protein